MVEDHGGIRSGRSTRYRQKTSSFLCDEIEMEMEFKLKIMLISYKFTIETNKFIVLQVMRAEQGLAPEQ